MMPSRRLTAAVLAVALSPAAAIAQQPWPVVPPPPHSLDGPFRFTGPYRPLPGPPVVDVPSFPGRYEHFGPYGVGVPLPNGPYPSVPGLMLPGGFVLEIDPRAASDKPPARVDRWRTVGAYIRTCWSPPPEPSAAPAEPRQVTLRLGFNRAGHVLGQPRVTYAMPAPDTEVQKAFTAAARAALAHCSPIPFTGGLGQAIAGVPFTLRFTDRRSSREDTKTE